MLLFDETEICISLACLGVEQGSWLVYTASSASSTLRINNFKNKGVDGAVYTTLEPVDGFFKVFFGAQIMFFGKRTSRSWFSS